MISFFKIKLIKIAEILHLRIFGHEMGDEMRKFLGNLSISFLGGAIYSVLLFAVSILAGRFLGPVNYGKYALYTALFSFLTIFISFGLETTIVRLAAKANEERKKRILSTFIIFFFCNSIFWSLIFLIFNSCIADFFGIPAVFIIFAVLFSVTNSLGIALENYLKIMNQFMFVNIIRIFQGCFLFFSLVVLYFLFNGLFSLAWFITLNVIASVLVLAIFLFKTKNYFILVFDKEILKELFLFSSSMFFCLISGYLIQSGTNVLIGKFIGLRELGFYNAYYFLSMAVTVQLIAFFVSAYFPALAKATNNEIVIKKIDKLLPMVALPWLVINSLVMFFGVKLFGSSYPNDIIMIILFSLYSLFYLYGVLYGYIVISNARSIEVRNMYLIWCLIVAGYFFVLFFLSAYFNLNVHVILLLQVFVFGVNVFLNRYYCGRIINN